MRRNKSKRPIEAEVIDGTGSVVKYGTAHVWPYLPPWGLAVAVGVIGVTVHLLWGGSAVGMGAASAGITLAGVAVTAMAWKAGIPRGTMTQLHATVSIALAVVWVLAALIAGPGRPVADIWLIGAPTVALTWNIRKGLRGQGDGNGWAEFAASTGLAKTRVQHPVIDGARVDAELTLAPGQTLDDVQAEKARLATALRIAPNAVRVAGDPDDASKARITVTTKDMLKQRVPWTGPSAIGASIARPIPIGTYENGATAQLWLPGAPKDNRNATLLLVNGMAGSGKTKGAQLIVSEIGSRADAAVIGCDPVKGMQTLNPVRDALAGKVTTIADAKKLIVRIRDAARHRANELGKLGLSEWVEGCELPYLVLWLEEAAAYLPGSDRFAEVAREVRSTGVGLVVSLQRTTHRAMHTDARQQFGGGLCFGVADIDDATFVLSDHTIEAGARPDVWGTRKPGCAYLEAPGIAEDMWSVPLRTHDVSDDDLARGAARSVYTPIDGGTAAILSDLISDDYRAVNQIADPIITTVARPHLSKEPNLLAGSIDEAAEGIDGDALDELPLTVPANPEPGFLDDIDTSAEIEDDGDDLVLAATNADAPKLSAEDAEAALIKYLNELFDTDAKTVSPAALREVRSRIGRSRSWVSRRLTEHAATGALTPTSEPGVYALSARIAP